MARELAPAGLRSDPRIFAPAAQSSGSKLPRHRDRVQAEGQLTAANDSSPRSTCGPGSWQR
ncbi:hypothetical protein DZG01_15895 [Pseudomonas fluorescens]|nr:hypothetical protein DZG01_15895 [Pseudomonas fluorescens]